MAKLRVAVICGGRSGEHEVSLMSARSILSQLDRTKYEVVEVGITQEGQWIAGSGIVGLLEKKTKARRAALLAEPGPARIWAFDETPEAGTLRLELWQQVDVVFPVLHGTFGEDGTLQGLLEMAEVPYVGAGVLASSVAMDKGLFKDLMRAHAIPQAEYAVCLRSEVEANISEVIRRAEGLASYPLFTKPANLGSSVGITKCSSRSDLVEGLREAARYDRRIVIERGVDAREIEASVLGNDELRSSLPGEVIPSREFYSYEAKYVDGTSRLLIPASLSEDKIREIQGLAVQACKAIDCAGMARVDFLLERKGERVLVNEVNTIPGFTKISMYPKLWEASGIPYPKLLDKLIELALQRQIDKSKNERSYEAPRG
ncbi:MAG: D-alanine--D-alanine ligase family protein [Anaerolineales bacterium]